MAKLTRWDAKSIASKWCIPLDVDFHTLHSTTVEAIVSAADEHRYRQPKNANGSRARYYHAYLVRAASRKD